jgi:hypothetical protein
VKQQPKILHASFPEAIAGGNAVLNITINRYETIAIEGINP